VRIALDAMGSDSAPRAELEGVALALDDDPSLQVALVGREQILSGISNRYPGRLELIPAPDVVGMHESPGEALKRKRKSSIAVCLQLLKEGKVDGMVSAGNTGAVMAFAITTIGVVPGIRRPALGILLPNVRGSTMVLDVGANIDTKPHQLLQFGLMGSTAVSYLFKKANPRVGLLNVGREDTKGTELILEAHRLFKESELNFAGNVEGNDILQGTVDVVVCDGFVGNVLLKYAEGLAEVLAGMLSDYLESESKYRLRRWLSKPVLHEFINRMDYEKHGGSLMLGVRAPVVVAHGRSTSRAIKNALRSAGQAAHDDVAGHVARRFERLAADAS
jgi:glycerol-3-phosphate acyltransferase PlsX